MDRNLPGRRVEIYIGVGQHAGKQHEWKHRRYRAAEDQRRPAAEIGLPRQVPGHSMRGGLLIRPDNRQNSTVTATASFFRPLLNLEIVRNGEVIATAEGDGARRSLQLTATVEPGESCWVAAREALAARWEKELEYYRTANLVFPDDAKEREFFDRAQQTLDILRKSPVLRYGPNSENARFTRSPSLLNPTRNFPSAPNARYAAAASA